MKQPELSKKIAELRKAKGYTQEELVEKCNLSVRTLQRIESGEVTPRSYTIKTIFTALDYTVYDSSESTDNGFSKSESIVSNWLEQFYRYVIDLFNLKTNTMKKISILSVLFFLIIFGAVSLFTDGQAQNDSKKNYSKNPPNSKMAFTNYSCGVCFNENDVMTGRDVMFKCNGVTLNVKLISLNTNTREFNAGFVKGKLFQNKVEVSCGQDLLNDGNVKYIADQVEKSGSKIILKGNTKLTSSQNETIEADEIIITTN